MMAQRSPAPPGSRIEGRLPGAHFWDAWTAPLALPDGDGPAAGPAPSLLALYLATARRTPAWVEACMALRNRVVRALGLKDLGALSALDPSRSAADYRVGDRVGIFTLIEHRADELLLGDSDRHLDVVVSLHRGPRVPGGEPWLTVTTVVHLKNRLGRLYMGPVRPMHHLIARRMTVALARQRMP